MYEISLRETRDLLEQVRRDVYLRPSRVQSLHLVQDRRSGSCGDTATVRSKEEGHVLDGDRSMADRRDLLESELQKLVWEAFCEGWTFGDEDLPNPDYCGYAETTEANERYNKRIHELLISYLDGPTSDVGAQDETPEKGEMGDGVRSEGDLTPDDMYAFVWNMFVDRLRRAHADQNNIIGNCEIRTLPNGEVIGHAKYV